MKIIKYIPVLVFALGASLTSCSDFLDAENKSNPEDAEQYFTKNPEELLYTTNDRMKTLVNRIDIFVKGTDLYVKQRGGNGGDFNVYSTLSAENSDVLDFYKAAYDMINNANGVIYFSEDKESKTCQEAMFLRAYGYYLLTQHFGSIPYVTTYTLDASRDFPRTPLEEVYTNIITDLKVLADNSNLPATDHTGHPSQKAAKALLAKVYLAAAWDLDVTLDNAEKGTYTVNSKERFSEAARYADAAISDIPLTMSFEDKWAQENEGNNEEIFSVQYDKASWPGDQSSSGHSFQNNFGNYYLNSITSGYKYVGSENGQSMKSAYLYEEGDTRYEATFMTTFYNYSKGKWGETGYYAFYNKTESELENLGIGLRFFPYWVTVEDAKAELAAHKSQYKQGTYANTPTAIILASNAKIFRFENDGTAQDPETKSLEDLHNEGNGDLCVRKFDDANSDQVDKNNDYRDIVLFHASDIYLVAAEAYYMAGNTTEANKKLNAVRGRAGVVDVDLNNPSSYRANNVFYSVPASFGSFTGLDMILDERARELYAESNRWEDLKRTKQLVRYNIAYNVQVNSISDMSNAYGEVKWLRPIPADEIGSNAGITSEDQNAGY